MHLLAIDQGTSSTKALVVGADGQVLAESTVDVSPRFLGGGAVEQDPQELLESIVEAGRRAIRRAGVPVEAIGLANQGETVLDWDPSSGLPIGSAISWQDNRAAQITDEVASHRATLESISGLPLDPYFAAPKMTWLKRHRGQRGLITTIDTWINYRLTGRILTDAATASRTMLLDLGSGGWSAEAMEIFGVDLSSVEIVDCGQTVGETDVFGATAPIAGLIVDQQAALLAQACLERAQAKCTYGTGAFLLANAGDRPTHSRSGLAVSVAWRLGATTTYCLDGQVFSAGAAVTWLTRIGLLADASEIDRLLDGIEPIDPRAPLFVPALAGLGAPQWLPHARAVWQGLSLATTREDLVAAVISGIAAQVAVLAKAVAADLGQPLTALRVDGGLSRCQALMQAQADLLQIPVDCYPGAHATALGVAALARIGAGGARSVSDALGARPAISRYEPEVPGPVAEEYLAQFSSAATTLRNSQQAQA